MRSLPARAASFGIAVAAVVSSTPVGAQPASYLDSKGAPGSTITPLLWGLLVASVIVVLVISALVLAGVLKRRRRSSWAYGERMDVARGLSYLRWVYGGLIATTLILIGFVAWTTAAVRAISAPDRPPALTIEVTGNQWWWEARYLSDDPAQVFTTANELHIPVNEPVRIVLRSSDVIHSFWVPALSGKTDAIPGRTNETWLRAEKTGVYLGRCAEYCGQQHAHMAMRVFATSVADFERWRRNQIALQSAPTGEDARKGQMLFLAHCGICHSVRGTPAGGRLGPDLTHLMTRTAIAADTLTNTPAHLKAWITAPQTIKPGNEMPAPMLDAGELTLIHAYLKTLH